MSKMMDTLRRWIGQDAAASSAQPLKPEEGVRVLTLPDEQVIVGIPEEYLEDYEANAQGYDAMMEEREQEWAVQEAARDAHYARLEQEFHQDDFEPREPTPEEEWAAQQAALDARQERLEREFHEDRNEF